MKWTWLAVLLALSPPQSVPTTEQSSTIEGRVLILGTSDPIPAMPVRLVTASPYQKIPQSVELMNAMDDLALFVAAGLNSEVLAVRISEREKSMGLPSGTLLPPRISTTVTDEMGNFSFKSLAPGMYSLRLERNGYFALRSNGDPWPVDGRRVTIEPGKATGPIEFRMFQGGTVSGRVRDPEGNLVANVNVLPSQIVYEDGSRNAFENGRGILSPPAAALPDVRTDDRGEFRLFAIPPGQYYIEAKPPLSHLDETSPGKSIWARTFSPNATTPSAARLVTVQSGDEVSGVDITFRRDDTRLFKISGTVRNAIPYPPANSSFAGRGGDRSVGFILVPREPSLLDPEIAPSFQNAIPVGMRPNGEFEIRNIRPGSYDLYADYIGELNPDVKVTRLSSGSIVNEFSIPRRFISRTPVEIRDQDVTGLTMTVNPGVDLDGEVVVRGSGAAGVVLNKLKVSLRALESMPRHFARVDAPSVDDSGRFHATNIPEGRYRLVVGVLPDNAYVEDIRQNGQSVYDDGFVLSSSSTPIQVVVNSGGNIIEGIVKDRDQKPVSRATVLLVPAENMRRNPARYRTAYSDESGKFNMQKVPTGLYTAFALERALPSSWMNADVLANYQDKGKIVNVVPNSRIQLQLLSIPPDEQ